MFTSRTDLAIKQWRLERIELNDGASLSTISNAEKILDFNFPGQFKELYVKVNGFKDNDWRENLFTIWPITKILEEYVDNSDKNFIGFSDYSINVHQIGFVRGQEGIFRFYTEPEKFTNSFKEAIMLINSDSELIY